MPTKYWKQAEITNSKIMMLPLTSRSLSGNVHMDGK